MQNVRSRRPQDTLTSEHTQKMQKVIHVLVLTGGVVSKRVTFHSSALSLVVRPESFFDSQSMALPVSLVEPGSYTVSEAAGMLLKLTVSAREIRVTA